MPPRRGDAIVGTLTELSGLLVRLLRDTTVDRDLLIRALRPLLPELTRFACWLARSREAADELTQEVVLRALGHAAEIEDPARLRAWLFRTARNAHLDAVRARAARERFTVIEGGEENDPESVPVSLPDPIERVALEQALSRLAEPARSVVLLVDLWQLSYDEAAGILDVPVNTVRSRLARARARLAVLLSGTVAGSTEGERDDDLERGGGA